jgi:hypothetical protein
MSFCSGVLLPQNASAPRGAASSSSSAAAAAAAARAAGPRRAAAAGGAGWWRAMGALRVPTLGLGGAGVAGGVSEPRSRGGAGARRAGSG